MEALLMKVTIPNSSRFLLVLTLIVLFAVSVIGFNWNYERNEPKWMTPIVEKIAPFFPAKDSYGGKQKTLPKEVR